VRLAATGWPAHSPDAADDRAICERAAPPKRSGNIRPTGDAAELSGPDDSLEAGAGRERLPLDARGTWGDVAVAPAQYSIVGRATDKFNRPIPSGKYPTRPLDTRLALPRWGARALLAAPIKPGPRPPSHHSVRLLRPPEDAGLRVVLVAPILGARTVFSLNRERFPT
jgi:hypothetical protein